MEWWCGEGNKQKSSSTRWRTKTSSLCRRTFASLKQGSLVCLHIFDRVKEKTANRAPL